MPRIRPTMKTAIGATRSEMRRHGRSPHQHDADEAVLVLDDLSRAEPNLLASIWYLNASDEQVKRFKTAWRKWQQVYIEQTQLPIKDHDERIMTAKPYSHEGVHHAENRL